MGEGQKTARAAGRDRMLAVLITGTVLSLPVFLPGALGGLHSLIPLPVFYYLLRGGPRQGILIVGGGMLLTAVMALALGAGPYLMIPLALAPLGFVLARAARNHESPLRAGMAGVLFLGGLLLVLGLLQAVFGQGNPYAALVANLEHGLAAARDFYQSADLPTETRKEVEAILTGLGEVLPRVLPGLLAMTVLGTVWVNLAAGNWLLRKKTDKAPWAPYRQWRLPEALVWGVILAGIAIMAPATRLNIFGLNLLLGLGLLYFFQGLAVLAFLLGRWSAPRPLRWAIYILLLIQFYGILVVAILGLVDIWANFRNRTPKPNHQE